MTYLINTAAEFAADALRGFVAAHPQYVMAVRGGVVRSTETPPGQPALVIGGGSGHYPAFAGWVGPGMAHGAPCGNIFSSPSASQVHSVARSAERGGGVILGFGNYAGDVLHFGAAAEKLRAEGIDVRIVTVSDDIASGTADKPRDRRGVAGGLAVFKIAGAAIEAGADIDDAERVAWKANDATRTFGVAFDGCTLPGAGGPLFRVDEGQMAVGLGIHGEPGVQDLAMGTATDVADLLLDRIMSELPAEHDGRIAVILNGLGAVKYEELFVVYGRITERIDALGLTPVRPEVGEFVTSLDMAGLSLTIVVLDDELERYWLAPVETPAFRRGEVAGERPARTGVYAAKKEAIPPAAGASQQLAHRIVGVLDRFVLVCTEHEDRLGSLDSVAGDGDHGSAMLAGTRGAVQAARAAVGRGAGARTVLVHAGAAWSDAAGGTSGALWGAALTAAARELDDHGGADDVAKVAALVAAVDAIRRLGGASVGDKTMVDAAAPYVDALREGFETTGDLAAAAAAAARVATESAEQTAALTARLGRARVLGAKSLGTPDPGAVSFALLAAALADELDVRGRTDD